MTLPYNLHSHTAYCDGHASPQDYIAEAIRLKMKVYGFAGHAPVPFANPWSIAYDKLSSYLTEISRLKLHFADKLHIYRGLEIDYLPGVTQRIRNFKNSYKLDYTIGAVHFCGQFDDGRYFDIAGKQHSFEQGFTQIFQSDWKKITQKYFELNLQMLHDDPPDIIAHIDLIKNHVARMPAMDNQSGFYKKLSDAVLREIKRQNVVLELNTRGWYKQKTTDFYPSASILAAARKLDIPVTISTDAHSVNEIALGMPQAVAACKLAGYNNIYTFDEKWIEIAIV